MADFLHRLAGGWHRLGSDGVGLPYIVIAVNQAMGGTPEYDVWRQSEGGEPQRLIASYAFKHQATEVVEVLNKWATAEV